MRLLDVERSNIHKKSRNSNVGFTKGAEISHKPTFTIGWRWTPELKLILLAYSRRMLQLVRVSSVQCRRGVSVMECVLYPCSRM